MLGATDFDATRATKELECIVDGNGGALMCKAGGFVTRDTKAVGGDIGTACWWSGQFARQIVEEVRPRLYRRHGRLGIKTW